MSGTNITIQVADESEEVFKGNVDLEKLDKMLNDEVLMVVMTLTNNTMGGQPVSLENVLAAKKICQAHHVPMWIDGCRIHENAYFI